MVVALMITAQTTKGAAPSVFNEVRNMLRPVKEEM